MQAAAFSGVRARLIALVLLALLPALGLILYIAHHHSREALSAAREQMHLFAYLTAADYSRLVDNTHQLLTALARLPEIREGRGQSCNALMGRVKSGYAQYANLGAILPDGTVFCSAHPQPDPVNASDRSFFRKALATREFSIGEYQIGRITGKPVVVLAYPDYDSGARLRAIVFAAVDLTWLNSLMQEEHLPKSLTLTLLDSRGVVLNRYPDPEKWSGVSYAGSTLFRAIRETRGEGMVEDAGLDGVRRIYAFAPLRHNASNGGAFIAIGIPHHVVYAGVERSLILVGTGLTIVTVLVLLAAWYGGNVFLLRRLNALVSAAQRLARGETGVRSGIRDGGREIAQLAHTFDEMAETIERRDTDLRRSALILKESEERFRSLVETTSDWIWEVDTRGIYTYASPKIRDLLGYTPEEIVGKTPFDFMPPDEAARIGEQFTEIVAARRPFEHLENTNLHKEGGRVVIETSGIPIFDSEGRLAGYRGVDRDITKRKQVEAAYHQAHELLEKIFTTTHILIAYLDTDFNFVRVNRAYAEADGRSPEFFADKNHFALYPGAEAEAIFRRVVQTGEPCTVYARPFTYPDHPERGVTYWDWSLQPVRDPGGKISGLVFSLVNVTDRVHAQEQVQYLAYHDELTGLPNRTLLLDRLRQNIVDADRHKRQVAVLCLDLNDFKNVNDTLGYDIGNQTIKTLAGRLSECVRPGDTVARLGGDEFCVALADLAHPDDVAELIQKILGQFTHTFHVMDQDLYLATALGASLYPTDGRDPETLLKNADIAMYRAKERGDSYQYYSAEMTLTASEHLALENDLRHVLERNELLLHYQPQVNLASGKITGVEALVRWQHPERGMISPAKFIPLAENTNLIIPIGAWVLRTACAQGKAWQKQGLPPLRVAVNFSARQFRLPNLDSVIRQILDETALDPRRLDIELTESTLIQNPEAIATVLGQLEKLGAHISVDDFGTGYSSLSYLKRFPIDILKIDQSFVRDIATDPDDAAIVIAIITMAHALGIQTIAEGVETQEQLDFLRQHGCDGMQGYFFSKPVEASAIVELFRSHKCLPVKKQRSRGKR